MQLVPPPERWVPAATERGTLRAVLAAGGLRKIIGVAVGAALTFGAAPARAESLIKNPNAHPDYRVELEPQAVFAFWHRRFSHWRTSRAFDDPELGAGFRATIELADPAFVPSINNNVGITTGLVAMSCECRGFSVQTHVLGGVQWSFWFTERLSAFAEAGPIIRLYDGFVEPDLDLFGQVGGRVSFNDDVALTMRLGYPYTVSLGASFFVGS